MLRIVNDAANRAENRCVSWPDANQNKKSRQNCQRKCALHVLFPFGLSTIEGARNSTLRTRCQRSWAGADGELVVRETPQAILCAMDRDLYASRLGSWDRESAVGGARAERDRARRKKRNDGAAMTTSSAIAGSKKDRGARCDSDHCWVYGQFPEWARRRVNKELRAGVGHRHRLQHHAVMGAVPAAASGQTGIRLGAGKQGLQRQQGRQQQ